MHRLVTIDADYPDEEICLVEQPSAPVLFLTSASTDIVTLSTVLANDQSTHWKNKIRALPLNSLDHPVQIDHYISTTAKE